MYNQEWSLEKLQHQLDIFAKTSHPEPKPSITEDKIKQTSDPKFHNGNIGLACMPNPVETLGYIKCYNYSSPRPIKSYSNYIRYNCQKIYGRSRRLKTILEVSKSTKPITSTFFKDFINQGLIQPKNDNSYYFWRQTVLHLNLVF